MNLRPTRSLLAVGAGLLVIASALSVVATPVRDVFQGPSQATVAPSGSAPPPADAGPSAASPPSAGPGSDPAATMATAAVAATAAAGVDPRVEFLPRASATPSEEQAASEAGHVTPLYSEIPAPIGLADYGLSAAPNGTIEASFVNTTSLRGEVDVNATGIQPLDLMQTSPDGFAIQLNAVLTNVTLFGKPGYSYWTQNVVTYDPATDFMNLVTNVWNFSGGALNGSAFYKLGPHGALVGTSYYYATIPISKLIAYPFDLALYLNSTILDGRDAVNFSVTISGPGVPGAAERAAYPSYDYVIFNSLAKGEPALTVPSNYTADGFRYNPVGITDDFELVLGGPGGGSQADLFAADAALALEYLANGTYEAVPSAFNYGGETGETVTGANVNWESGAGGPNSAATYGTMTSGPSDLRGLWNATGAAGAFPVTLAESPSNAFNFVAPVGGRPGFANDEPTYAPNAFNDTFWLSPGTYSISVELTDYDPEVVNVTVPSESGTGLNLSINLTKNLTEGIYTPLWAFSNAEVADLASRGNGTPMNPYVLANDQPAPLGPEFGLYNDFTFPVFPGVFLMNTNVSVELYQPANFSTTTNASRAPGAKLPELNDLPMWFWNESNVSIVGAEGISGWFGNDTWYPLVFDPFNVVFYESSGNLIAHNDFDTESEGLLLFSGGTPIGKGPLNVGGGNNTVWGNTFEQQPTPTACTPDQICDPLIPGGDDLGLEVAEEPDLIYNNYFDTATTAWEPPVNLYTGNKDLFSRNLWNVTPEPASDVRTLADFPLVPLAGSIAGTAQQGGNLWWDYGLGLNPHNRADNPYGVLPYDENGTTPIAETYGSGVYHASYIYPGGDHDPLIDVTLYSVELEVSGRTAQTPRWGGTVSMATGAGTDMDEFSTTVADHVIYLPSGTYRLVVLSPYYTTEDSSGLVFTVAGANSTLGVKLALGSGFSVLTFREQGLPTGTSWGVTIVGNNSNTWPYNASASNSTATQAFDVADGPYGYNLSVVPGEAPNVAVGYLTVAKATTVVVTFKPRVYPLTFVETGLKTKESWKVTIASSAGKKAIASTRSTIVFEVTNGSYSYSIKGIPGKNVSVWDPETDSSSSWTGSVMIQAAAENLSATFTPDDYVASFQAVGLPTSSIWSVTIHGETFSSTGPYINVSLPNGTYRYKVTPPTGMKASPSKGSIRLKAAGKNVTIRLTLPPSEPSAAPSTATTLTALVAQLARLVDLA